MNHDPLLFSFYGLFQAISGDLLSALGQLCQKRFPGRCLSLSTLGPW